MTKFFSWIPTVSGRLSYSHIGESRWPTKCVRTNYIGDSNYSQAIFFQARYCDDFVVPFLPRRWGWLRNKVVSCIHWQKYKKTLSGQHFFVGVVDRVIDQDKPLDRLKGRIFPVLDIKVRQTSGRKIASDIKSKIAYIEDIETEMSGASLSALVDSIKDTVDNVCPVVIEFTLCRNGIVELTPRANSDMQVSESKLKDYAEQAFFFLRDISHNHQHHESDSDTIVRVHGENDDYRKKIYFDLFRYIIRFKRTRSPENIMRASGLLAYANSFKNINKDENNFPNDYQIENLKMSLDAAHVDIEYRTQRRNSRTSFALTASFSFFGALLALTALSQFAKDPIKDTIVPDLKIIWLTNYIAANPIATVTGCIVLGWVSMLAFGRIRPNRFVWFENIQRLLNHKKSGYFYSPLPSLES